MRSRVLALGLLLGATNCSWCSAPKPTPENEPSDLDAAPHAEGDVHARCGDAPASRIALPAAGDAAFEIGRVRTFKQRVVVGARRGARAGLLEIDGMTARFTETSDAAGDSPPPVPVVTADRVLAVAYEGTGKTRHLVARDAASPAAPLFALDPEAPDESLAFDAIPLADGAIAVAWDAPPKDASETEGSAIWARVWRAGKLGDATRLSPKDVDGDTPRLVAFGPALVATWIAHRPLVRDRDAAVEPEGAGQDLDHAWIEMLAFDQTTLAPTSPLRHVTNAAGRVTAFDVEPVTTSPLPAMTVVARDGIELQAGQGGSAIVVHVSGPDPSPPLVLTNHLGRGLPLYVESNNLLLYDDAAGQGRTASDGGVASEPFSNERPLLVLPTLDHGDAVNVLFAPVAAKELDVFRCATTTTMK